MHNEYDENLLEPLKYYNNYLKGHFRKVTEDYFQELVDEAGIDIDKNTELMKEYEEASRNFSGLKSKLNRYLFTKKSYFYNWWWFVTLGRSKLFFGKWRC